jgi:hypothetical protein
MLWNSRFFEKFLYGGYFKTYITKFIAKFSLPSVASTFLRNVPHKIAGEVRGATTQKTATCMVNYKQTSDPACNKFRAILKTTSITSTEV